VTIHQSICEQLQSVLSDSMSFCPERNRITIQLIPDGDTCRGNAFDEHQNDLLSFRSLLIQVQHLPFIFISDGDTFLGEYIVNLMDVHDKLAQVFDLFAYFDVILVHFFVGLAVVFKKWRQNDFVKHFRFQYDLTIKESNSNYIYSLVMTDMIKCFIDMLDDSFNICLCFLFYFLIIFLFFSCLI